MGPTHLGARISYHRSPHGTTVPLVISKGMGAGHVGHLTTRLSIFTSARAALSSFRRLIRDSMEGHDIDEPPLARGVLLGLWPLTPEGMGVA